MCPQSVWASGPYPAMKAWPIYTPPEPWQVNPEPPIPDPPYPNYWWPNQPHASQPWMSKPIGAMPPAKIHMRENLQRTPPFGFWKIYPGPGPWDYTGPSSKHWMKQKMLGQGIDFFMHIYTVNDDGTTMRQVVKIKPKKNLQNWRQYLNDPRFRRHRLTKPKTPSGHPDLFA
jgi:hypothetical protein